MQTWIKKMHENRLFSLILWLVVAFLALVYLPNLTTMSQYNGQPQLPSSSQPIKAQQISNHWGQDLDGTYTANVVFNNPSGKITAKQQVEIDKTIARLQKDRLTYGIKKITTATNTPVNQPQLMSKDGSTQVIELAIAHSQGAVRTISHQIEGRIATTGVETYLTSPEIINDANNEKIASTSTLAIVAVFVLVLITLGILFRSIVVPLMTFLATLIAYLASLSFATNLTWYLNFPYSQYTPLVLLLVTTVFGTLTMTALLRQFREHLIDGMNGRDATARAVRYVRYPTIATATILTLAFASLYFFKFSSIRALSMAAVAVIMMTLAVLTLLPILMRLLGERFFWPRKNQAGTDHQHRYWHQLTRFALWQPFAAIILVAYLIGPFALSYRPNFNFATSPDINTDQAVKGARVLSAHFGQGKATPVTVYLKNNETLDNQSALSAIDQLTNKLKSTPEVASVTSITQPGGMPIKKYYVASQINTISRDLKGVQGSLNQTNKSLKSDKKKLASSTLDDQVTKLNDIATKADQINTTGMSAAQALRDANRKAKIAANLRQAASDLQTLNSDLKQNASDTKTASSTLKDYSTSISKVNSSLGDSQDLLKGSNKTLNGLYNYLTGLGQSEAAKAFYLTPSELKSPDFQQSIFNGTDKTNKITKLTVTLKQSPTAANTDEQVAAIKRAVTVTKRGTVLKSAEATYTGQPVVQSTIQRQFNHNIPMIIAMVFGLLLLGMMIVSRSVLQPTYWMMGFLIAAFSSLQISQLIIHFTTGNPTFNWEILLITTLPVAAIGGTLMIGQAIDLRYHQGSLIDWIMANLTERGNVIWMTLVAIILPTIGLLVSGFGPIATLAVMMIMTTLLYSLIHPLTVAAFGKLTETLPGHKPRINQHGD